MWSEKADRCRGNRPRPNTKGSYANSITNGERTIPRSVYSELNTSLFNLEFLQLTLKQKKAAKMTQGHLHWPK